MPTKKENPREIDAYTHEQKRANNPPAGLARSDSEPDKIRRYRFDDSLDPCLEWAGKAEGVEFGLPASSIHRHEAINPFSIIARAQKERSEGALDAQLDLFATETPRERLRRRKEAIEFYRHGIDWTNRLIAGDSLVVMNSLLQKEGMAGQVQMLYIDPPYGIKYGSNFQAFVNSRDVKDKKDEDLTQEPEMVKAFRDTWELGIHSYLTYLHRRLLLARELLNETGSCFVQISDENVHLVRCLMDEVFGRENFVSMIIYTKTSGATAEYLSSVSDFIIWYAKNKKEMKYHALFVPKGFGAEGTGVYKFIELANGERMTISEWEKKNGVAFNYDKRPKGSRIYSSSDLTSQTGSEGIRYPVEFMGKTYTISNSRGWRTSEEGMERLKEQNRLFSTVNSLRYINYFDDFPYMQINNLWQDTGTGSFLEPKVYIVQTNTKAIQRCLLMTTDPGDLVMDITSGSGTTAFVAEQWGRRWIACDTSRVAIAIAKQRLITASFDYYRLADEAAGVDGGFVYKTVPHVTLKSIANDEAPLEETLYDAPEVDKTRARVTGPFTVEALPAPVVLSPQEAASENVLGLEDDTAKTADWREQLLATGIVGRGGARLEFSRVEPMSASRYFSAEAETKEESPRRAVICFAGETKPLDARTANLALDEASLMHPYPQIIVFAAFQFDPEAARDIDEAILPDPSITVLKAQMNTDLMTEDLKSKRSSDQSFWLVGQPDVEIMEEPASNGQDSRGQRLFRVKVNGFDYYNVKTGMIESGGVGRIAMWMLDADYDGMCLKPSQVFFPMDDGWRKLARSLKAELDAEVMEQFAGNVSLPFPEPECGRVAVKIIDDRGIESLKVISLELRT